MYSQPKDLRFESSPPTQMMLNSIFFLKKKETLIIANQLLKTWYITIVPIGILFKGGDKKYATISAFPGTTSIGLSVFY